jgi:hypothetical protein
LRQKEVGRPVGFGWIGELRLCERGVEVAAGVRQLLPWRLEIDGSEQLPSQAFPLAYNPATGALAARILLTENVTVFNGGQSFKDTFTQDVYDPSWKTLVLHMLGTITGQRVLPN